MAGGDREGLSESGDVSCCVRVGDVLACDAVNGFLIILDVHMVGRG